MTVKPMGTPTAEKVRETWLLRGKLTKGVLFFAAVLIIAFITWVVFIYTKSQADQKVFEAIAPHITPQRTRFMLFVTFLGNAQFLVPASLLLLAFFLIMRRGWLALRITVIMVGGLLIKLGMKQLFHRVRPIDPIIEGGVAGFSFPSGHALMSLAFYGFLSWWAAIDIRNKWLQGIVIAFLIFLICMVSISRVYLRVHYTTDILTGICMGFCWLIFGLWLVDKLEVRSMQKKKSVVA